MTCYQRHLGWLFEALELEYDPANRRRVDVALKNVLGLDPATHCPEVWAAFKALTPDEQSAIVPALRESLG